MPLSETFSMLTSSQLDLGLALLLAHALADFVLQPDWMVKRKERAPVLLAHSAIAAAASYLLVGRWSLWLVPLWILFSHAAIDYVKVRSKRNTLGVFLADQAAHLGVIAALTWFFGQAETVSYWLETFGADAWRCGICAIGLVFCIHVGGILVGFWVRPYLEEIGRAVASGEQRLPPARGLTHGGRIIGQLERLLIFVFVGLGTPASIGFLIAAKSIFRFGELKDRENRMEAEYITIGTLLSFAWAIVVSYAAWWLMRRI